MTRDVMISIRGLQFQEDEAEDNIETVQQGEYFFRNGSHFLLYDEYMEDFREPARSVIRIREGEMTLTRKGLLNVQMNFSQGKKTLKRYQTPYGSMTIGLDTDRVECRATERALCVEVDYALEANYQYVADCHIRIEVREKGGERFDFFDEERGESEEWIGS